MNSNSIYEEIRELIHNYCIVDNYIKTMGSTGNMIVYTSFVIYLVLVGNQGSQAQAQAQPQPQQWCVPQPFVDDQTLQDAIDFACSKIDCKPIQPGGACFTNNKKDHARYAMNAYFSANGRNPAHCQFKHAGEITNVNPSN